MIGWSQAQLAEASGTPGAAIADFEAERSIPDRQALEHLVAALRTAGIDLVEGNGGGVGVRWSRSDRPPVEGKRPDQLDATNDD